MKQYLFTVLVAIGLSAYAQSTLSGEFTFAKKPPFAGLVVFGEDQSKAGKDGVVLDQKDKMFSKKIIVVPKGTAISFKNSDQIDHNIFADDKDAEVEFDVGLVTPGNAAEQKSIWPEGTVARIGCKIHPKMRSYVAVISSAYYAEVEFDTESKTAAFTIKDVPDELTKVTVWLPRYEKVELELKKGESKTVELKKPKKTKVYGTVTLKR